MTTTDRPADGTRWRGFSHKDLYTMLHDGPGAAASAEPSRRWAEISSTLAEVGQDLGKAIELTGSGWSGRASGAAYSRLSRTVGWAAETGESAATMRTSVENQADHIAKARADMPTPEDVAAVAPDPTVAPVAQVVAAQTDAEPAEASATSAEEKAVEVMAAYEENTNTTTSSLASFDAPKPIFEQSDIHHTRGGGLLGLGGTVVSGLMGGGSRQDRHDRGRDNRDFRSSPQTSGSSSHWDGGRRPWHSATPGPGKTMGVSTEPLIGPGLSSGGKQDERLPARGSSSGANPGGGHSSPGTGPRSGAGNLPLAPNDLQQAAAASQAAASAHPGAGAPIAPTGAGLTGGQEKMALRRIGMDAIGSSQWFGDTEEPVVGEAPKRRFDLRDSVEAAESAPILDDELQLPPNVIGDGGR